MYPCVRRGGLYSLGRRMLAHTSLQRRDRCMSWLQEPQKDFAQLFYTRTADRTLHDARMLEASICEDALDCFRTAPWCRAEAAAPAATATTGLTQAVAAPAPAPVPTFEPKTPAKALPAPAAADAGDLRSEPLFTQSSQLANQTQLGLNQLSPGGQYSMAAQQGTVAVPESSDESNGSQRGDSDASQPPTTRARTDELVPAAAAGTKGGTKSHRKPVLDAAATGLPGSTAAVRSKAPGHRRKRARGA
jgi:hypothetical protein